MLGIYNTISITSTVMCDECHHATTLGEQEGYLQERSRTIGDTALGLSSHYHCSGRQYQEQQLPLSCGQESSFWGIHERWESNPRG